MGTRGPRVIRSSKIAVGGQPCQQEEERGWAGSLPGFLSGTPASWDVPGPGASEEHSKPVSSRDSGQDPSEGMVYSKPPEASSRSCH